MKSFENILKTNDNIINGLDFGCGIGRATIFMKEFNIESIGIDISETAINEAKKLSSSFGYNMDNKFILINDIKIPFEENYFDFVICDGVLDSMPFSIAKKVLMELDRCTKSYLFFSCIGYSNKNNSQAQQLIKEANPLSNYEYEIETRHEKGTIQTFYTEDKIHSLLKDSDFNIKELKQVHKNNLTDDLEIENRFFVIASK